MTRVPRPSAAAIARVPWRPALLRWYRRHRRDLPWRASRDPWHVWVSEVMLQQTRVSVVLPYYRTFLERWPDVNALARAPVDQVLRVWSGLGYYRRARQLHDAARIVARDHHGRVPSASDAFARLPGVGRYTLGAVLSIGFDRPLPVLDGNVARVLSRIEALSASVRDSRGSRELWSHAATLVPMRGAGTWNQALMELGALVCTPRSPRCDECPVRPWCRAHALGRTDAFPPASVRRASQRLRRAVAVARRGGRMLVVRQEGPLLTGLWEPPGIDLPATGEGRTSLRAALARTGVSARLTRTEQIVRHTITHRRIEVEVWRVEGVREARTGRKTDARWIDPQRPAVPLTALARKLAALTKR
jgi:A/G-specific adenine glycosylase